jgi:excisionase family DNA binding protein
MSDGLPEYLTVPEVAKRLKVHQKTVLGWIRNGELKAVRVGKSWRLLEPDVLAFIEASTEAERLERLERSGRSER